MSHFPPPRTSLVRAVEITVVVLLPLALTTWLAGGAAILPAVMALLCVTFVPYCTLRQAVLLCLGLVGVGVLTTVVHAEPVALVLLMVAVCIGAGLLSQLSAGAFTAGPIAVAVLGLDPPQVTAIQVAAVMIGVCGYVILVVRLLKVDIAPGPVPFDVALRHGLVMAVACGGATAIALYYDLPKSYWLVMTLAVVLRPYAIESLKKNRARVIGTVLGALIAVAMSPLPRPWQLVMAAVCMTLMFAYMAERNYVLQVTFMTPMVVFLVSSGTVDDTFYMDGLRVAYTVGACVVGGLVSLALTRGPDAEKATHH